MIRIAMLLVFLGVIGCQQAPPSSQPKFDSEHAVGIDATFSEGKIISSSANPAALDGEIREQIKYTIGQLNGLGGGPDINRLEISIGDVVERADGMFDVSYAAKLFLAWPRESRLPETFEFILPARGDYTGRFAFYEAYGADEDTYSACLDWSAHDVSVGIFWYYYRPAKRSCPLVDQSIDDPEVVVRLQAALEVSALNTNGKYPEYEKVWEDGRLVGTAIFGKNVAGTTGNDAGIAAFVQMYQELVATYGTPADTNLASGDVPSAVNDDVRLVFETDQGHLDVHLYLVDSIRSVGIDFLGKYNERTAISDFVSYSGHSGLGANIRAMASMGRFLPGQYQIFLINGCDTFAYVDHALRNAHHEVNPESGPDKFFDIITNAMPSYFHANARSNMAIIQGLLEQELTYREILAGFDRAQRAVVDGEADNAWPEAF